MLVMSGGDLYECSSKFAIYFVSFVEETPITDISPGEDKFDELLNKAFLLVSTCQRMLKGSQNVASARRVTTKRSTEKTKRRTTNTAAGSESSAMKMLRGSIRPTLRSSVVVSRASIRQSRKSCGAT